MPEYGLTPTGFFPKTLLIVREEIDRRLRFAFGESVPLGETTLLGQLAGIMADQYATLWELAEAVNSAQDPDMASDASLRAICVLTGTFARAAVGSRVMETLVGVPGTVVPAGSRVSTASTGAVFATVISRTIDALPAWQGSTAYEEGERVTNASRAYQCLTAGTSASSGGPTTTSADITDGTAHWLYLGEGAGAVDVLANSVETGPIAAVAGDLSVIVTPVGGLARAVNLLDATPGRDEDTDSQLRVHRDSDLTAPGTSPANSIRAALLLLPSVTNATVFVNATDVPDADGVPPHSIEALVESREGDDDDQAIRVTLFENTAAGIRFHGGEPGTVTDSAGNEHEVAFSRPTRVLVAVDITVTKDPATYPADGDEQIKAAIAAYGNARGVGYDAVAAAIGAQAFKVAGVLDVPRDGSLGGTLLSSAVDPGSPPTPTSDATITITNRQIAVYDTSRITVHSSDGTP